jgi:hypothetical protein
MMGRRFFFAHPIHSVAHLLRMDGAMEGETEGYGVSWLCYCRSLEGEIGRTGERGEREELFMRQNRGSFVVVDCRRGSGRGTDRQRTSLRLHLLLLDATMLCYFLCCVVLCVVVCDV